MHWTLKHLLQQLASPRSTSVGQECPRLYFVCLTGYVQIIFTCPIAQWMSRLQWVANLLSGLDILCSFLFSLHKQMKMTIVRVPSKLISNFDNFQRTGRKKNSNECVFSSNIHSNACNVPTDPLEVTVQCHLRLAYRCEKYECMKM